MQINLNPSQEQCWNVFSSRWHEYPSHKSRSEMHVRILKHDEMPALDSFPMHSSNSIRTCTFWNVDRSNASADGGLSTAWSCAPQFPRCRSFVSIVVWPVADTWWEKVGDRRWREDQVLVERETKWRINWSDCLLSIISNSANGVASFSARWRIRLLQSCCSDSLYRECSRGLRYALSWQATEKINTHGMNFVRIEKNLDFAIIRYLITVQLFVYSICCLIFGVWTETLARHSVWRVHVRRGCILVSRPARKLGRCWSSSKGIHGLVVHPAWKQHCGRIPRSLDRNLPQHLLPWHTRWSESLQLWCVCYQTDFTKGASFEFVGCYTRVVEESIPFSASLDNMISDFMKALELWFHGNKIDIDLSNTSVAVQEVNYVMYLFPSNTTETPCLA